MRYILFLIDTATNSGNQQEMIQIDAFNEKLQKANKFIFAAGIGSSKTATTFDNRAGKDQVTQESLNSDEFYSGFWIIQAEPNEIEDLAKQASLACNRKVEIRPFLA